MSRKRKKKSQTYKLFYQGPLIKKRKVKIVSESQEAQDSASPSATSQPVRRTPNGGISSDAPTPQPPSPRQATRTKKIKFVKGANEALATQIVTDDFGIYSQRSPEFADKTITYYIDVEGDALSRETIDGITHGVVQRVFYPKQEDFIEGFLDGIDSLTGIRFKRVYDPSSAERVIGRVYTRFEGGSLTGEISTNDVPLSNNFRSLIGSPVDPPEDDDVLFGNRITDDVTASKDVWIYGVSIWNLDSSWGPVLWDKLARVEKYRIMHALLASFGFQDMGSAYSTSETIMGSDWPTEVQRGGNFKEYITATDYRALLLAFGEP
jgi:hypothetical protein